MTVNIDITVSCVKFNHLLHVIWRKSHVYIQTSLHNPAVWSEYTLVAFWAHLVISEQEANSVDTGHTTRVLDLIWIYTGRF
jgi:hypothetical protein